MKLSRFWYFKTWYNDRVTAFIQPSYIWLRQPAAGASLFACFPFKLSEQPGGFYFPFWYNFWYNISQYLVFVTFRHMGVLPETLAFFPFFRFFKTCDNGFRFSSPPPSEKPVVTGFLFHVKRWRWYKKGTSDHSSRHPTP